MPTFFFNLPSALFSTSNATQTYFFSSLLSLFVFLGRGAAILMWVLFFDSGWCARGQITRLRFDTILTFRCFVASHHQQKVVDVGPCVFFLLFLLLLPFHLLLLLPFLFYLILTLPLSSYFFFSLFYILFSFIFYKYACASCCTILQMS